MDIFLGAPQALSSYRRGSHRLGVEVLPSAFQGRCAPGSRAPGTSPGQGHPCRTPSAASTGQGVVGTPHSRLPTPGTGIQQGAGQALPIPIVSAARLMQQVDSTAHQERDHSGVPPSRRKGAQQVSGGGEGTPPEAQGGRLNVILYFTQA